MKKYIFTISILVLFIEIVSISLISSLKTNGNSLDCDLSGYTCGNFTITNPHFNGNFTNRTTLFSNTLHIINSTIYGRDIYPIKNSRVTTQVCYRYEYTYNKTCTKYYDDICRRYNYHYEKECVKYRNNKCIRYKRVKVNEDCKIFRKDHSRRYKTTKIKGDCIKYQTREIYVTEKDIGCLDPDIGVFTNQLRLNNFKIKIDNGSWESIPYAPNQQFINDSNIMFKLDIPSICSPFYNINESIFIIS